MKPRKTLSVYVLLVGILGLSIVGGILAFQIFSATVKSQLTAEQREAVKPIDGTIGQTVINNLELRQAITEAELAALSITINPTPTMPPAIITPSRATSSATLVEESVSEAATPSGEQTIP